MLFPITDHEQWAKMYGLRIKKGKCLKCGIDVITDIPFILKGYRGLKSADHGCTEKYTHKTFKPYSDEEKERWDKALNGEYKQ